MTDAEVVCFILGFTTGLLLARLRYAIWNVFGI